MAPPRTEAQRMALWLQPIVKSMILCEDVVPGPAGTGNVHLMNVFSAIRPTSELAFPFLLRQLCVFLQLTDAEGVAAGRIVARAADTDAVVFWSDEHSIRFAQRLQLKWVSFRLKDRCVFPEPGVYFIEFHLDGRWFAEQPLHLRR
jgi:hypothetical protein